MGDVMVGVCMLGLWLMPAILAAGNRHSINKFEYTGNRSCKAGDRLVIVCIAVVWLEPFLCNRF